MSTRSEIDFVMGSGNHVRTYLHRTSRGYAASNFRSPGMRRKADIGR